MRYLFPALGAGLLAFMSPWFLKKVVNFPSVSYEIQAAVLAALGAVLGCIVGEKVGSKKGGG